MSHENLQLRIKNSRSPLSFEEIRERLSPLFCRQDTELVILFGSHATKRVHSRSDIDLGFVGGKALDILELTNTVSRMLRTDNIDIVDLRRASPLLRFAASRSSKLLYERSPGVYGKFCSLAFRRYVDTKKLREAQKTSIRIFLESRGLQ